MTRTRPDPTTAYLNARSDAALLFLAGVGGIGLGTDALATGNFGIGTFFLGFGLAIAFCAFSKWRNCRQSTLDRLRIDQGLCPNCGYDMRASRERCPECGNMPQ